VSALPSYNASIFELAMREQVVRASLDARLKKTGYYLPWQATTIAELLEAACQSK
jgi:hypothetical protein